MHFSKRPKERLMIAAESRPSSDCHPERSAAREVVEEERLGACGRRAVEGPLTSSAGGPAGRKKRELLRLRAALHIPAPSSAIFPTPPPPATRRSAQDDRLLEERSGRSPKCTPRSKDRLSSLVEFSILLSPATRLPMQNDPDSVFSRRTFIEKSAATLAPTALAGGFPQILRGAEDDKPIKIALVGCGGRGSGACSQALKADKGTVLMAMADAFHDRLDVALNNMRASFKDQPEKVKVTPETSFVGLDAIDKVLATDVDVVLLTTPPGFRAEHFEKCVRAGKHAFVEKPIAVDAPGYRRFMESAKLSKKKGLGVQSGFCWRSHYLQREVYQKIIQGELGQVMAAHGTYLGGTPWVHPRQEGWKDLEYHLRNWIHMTWLSGDHIVEQAIHTVDKMSWVFGDADPVSAQGMGGRQQRVEDQYGNQWDHFSIVYDYGDERRGFIMCRQQAGCWGDVSDYVYGTKGTLRKKRGSMA